MKLNSPSDRVHPRFSGAWYRRHQTSCLAKGVAFSIGAALNIAPFLLLFHARGVFSGSRVALGEVARRALGDTASASLVAGVFVGTYCGLNNAMEGASMATASASTAVAALCLSATRPRVMPQLALGGLVVGSVVWCVTPLFQLLAQEEEEEEKEEKEEEVLRD